MALEWNVPPVDDITTDELVTAEYLNKLGNSLNWLTRIDAASVTATVTVTSTSSASPTTLITLSSKAYVTGTHEFRFYCPSTNLTTAGATFIQLWQDSTSQGIIARYSAVTGAVSTAPCLIFPFEVTAGTYTFSVRSYVAGATTTYNFGPGGAGNNFPGALMVFRLPV